MRKAVWATAILMIVFLMHPLAMVAVVADAPSYQLWIEFPAESWNRIYNTTTVEVKISATTYTESSVAAIYYSLDGASRQLLNQADTVDRNGFYDYTAKGTLSNLANGEHSLRAYAVDSQGKTLTNAITFFVNTSHTYPAFILSPKNITYSENNIPLELAISSITDAQKHSENYYLHLAIDYLLDNSSKEIRLQGNTTLYGLADGQHKITVAAYTSLDSPNLKLYSEQITYFTIDTTKSNGTKSNDNQLLILASIAGVVTVCLVIFVAIQRNKRIGKQSLTKKRLNFSF